jgi:hypothetical protein
MGFQPRRITQVTPALCGISTTGATATTIHQHLRRQRIRRPEATSTKEAEGAVFTLRKITETASAAPFTTAPQLRVCHPAGARDELSNTPPASPPAGGQQCRSEPRVRHSNCWAGEPASQFPAVHHADAQEISPHIYPFAVADALDWQAQRVKVRHRRTPDSTGTITMRQKLHGEIRHTGRPHYLQLRQTLRIARRILDSGPHLVPSKIVRTCPPEALPTDGPSQKRPLTWDFSRPTAFRLTSG